MQDPANTWSRWGGRSRLDPSGEEDAPDGSPPPHDQPDASQAALEAGAEPNASVAGLDAARAKLRAEAFGWGVKEAKVEHILSHHPLAAAGNILWKARRQGHTSVM